MEAARYQPCATAATSTPRFSNALRPCQMPNCLYSALMRSLSRGCAFSSLCRSNMTLVAMGSTAARLTTDPPSATPVSTAERSAAVSPRGQRDRFQTDTIFCQQTSRGRHDQPSGCIVVALHCHVTPCTRPAYMPAKLQRRWAQALSRDAGRTTKKGAQTEAQVREPILLRKSRSRHNVMHACLPSARLSFD